MALADLASKAAPLSDADRLAQTAKLFGRTFGVDVSQLGTLAIEQGEPTLTFQHNDKPHKLTWRRDRNSAPEFLVNGVPVAGIGGEDSAARLLAYLG